jgi:glyoxylase-like metal-dependent hydrolase (beta-lactamase superfamily II)/rhodanese-related sulfurtransferase
VHFKQFYVGCLAHASYLIGEGDVAVVVDPSRDVQMYIDEAEAHGLRIAWVLETHLHADFVSGHRELAARTGAVIGIGARAQADYPHRALAEGDEVRFGAAMIRVLETPGHTPEHLSFVVYASASDSEPWGVLTGDTLFVGDVGRVDILSSRLPVTELAGLLYDSVHRKLLALPDATRVYPAHGAGSLCGRSIRKETWSTIGQERSMNPALRPMSRAEFVAEVTRDVPETPVYFLHARDLNQAGPSLDEERPMPPALPPDRFQALAGRGAIVLDTRPADRYGPAHVPASLHVPLDGQYASWVGTLVRPDQPILLVADSDRAEEAVLRLARIGYERVDGVLAGGLDAWREAGLPVASIRQVPAAQALASDATIVDVRRDSEWDAAHRAGARHIPLAALEQRAGELPRDAELVVTCASGYRSSIATSVLERAGHTRLVNAVGGIDAYRQAGLPLGDQPR